MPRRRYGNLRRRFRSKRRWKRRRRGAAGTTQKSLNRAARKEFRSRKPCVWKPLPIADNCLARLTFSGTNALTLHAGQTLVGGVSGTLTNPFEYIIGNQVPPSGYAHFGVATSAGRATSTTTGADVYNPYQIYLADKYARIRCFGSKLTVFVTLASNAPQNTTICLMPMTYLDYDAMSAKEGAQWSQQRGVLSSRVYGGGHAEKPLRVSAYATTASMFNIPKREVRDNGAYAQVMTTGTDPPTSTGLNGNNMWQWNLFGYHGAESGTSIAQVNWRITYYCLCDEKRKDYT